MDHIPERFHPATKKANPSHQDLRSRVPSTWMHIIIGHRTKGTLLLVMWCGPWAATGPRFCGSPATKGSLSLCSVGKCFFLCSKSSSWGPFRWWEPSDDGFLTPPTPFPLWWSQEHTTIRPKSLSWRNLLVFVAPAGASWVISSFNGGFYTQFSFQQSWQFEKYIFQNNFYINDNFWKKLFRLKINMYKDCKTARKWARE